MATNIRAQCTVFNPSEMVRDRIVNTVHFVKTVPEIIDEIEWTSLAQDLATLWAEFRAYPVGFTRAEVRLYDMADDEPRVPKAQTTEIVAVNANPVGPREVALCLSFFSEVNRPRNRGRIYVGPWQQTVMQERPVMTGPGNPGTYLAELAQGLQDIGGVDIDWNIWSVMDQEMKKVTDWWVDNEWDTMRSRGQRATTRVTGTTSE